MKKELQIYLQILANHTLLKYDWTLHHFLTCKETQEFEKFKSDPSEFAVEQSIAVSAIKDFRIKDTVNILYSTIKTKWRNNEEPEEIKTDLEFPEITKAINKYIEFLDKNIALIQTRIAYMKTLYDEQIDISNSFQGLKDSDAELENTYSDTALQYEHESDFTKFCIERDSKLLSEIKEEKLKQEGIRNAIADRKTVNFIT